MNSDKQPLRTDRGGIYLPGVIAMILFLFAFMLYHVLPPVLEAAGF